MRLATRLAMPLRQIALLAMPTLLLLTLLTTAFWVLLLESDRDLRRATLDNASYRAYQVNSAVSETISMLFFNVDEAAQSLVAFYKQNSLEEFSRQIDVIAHRFPENSLLQLAVIGADGYLKFSNLGTDKTVYLGDREHFQIHVNKPDNGLFISKPLMGKVSKKWTIQFSRRIEQNGKFLGVLVLSISPDYLYHTLEKLTRGSQDVLTIIRASGETMARSRDFEKSIGLKAAEDRPYLNSAPDATGNYHALGRLDRIDRFYHWHHLTEYPVIVVLGLDLAQLMAPVEKSIQQNYVKGLVTTSVIWITVLLAAYLSLRMQANIRKRIEFEYAAMHDTLTGLKNRKALIHHLSSHLQDKPVSNERLAVLFIDLDGFKKINDNYGHSAGDTVLRTAAQRLKDCARNSDFVARIGGDEFVIVCNDLRKTEDVQILLDRIQEAMSTPIDLDHQPLSVGASTGVAFYPENGVTAEELLVVADEAMYRDKERRKTLLQTNSERTE